MLFCSNIFSRRDWGQVLSSPLFSLAASLSFDLLFVLIISWTTCLEKKNKVILIYEHAVWMTVVGPSLLPRSQLYWIALYCTKSGFQCWHSNKCQGDISTGVIFCFSDKEMWCASTVCLMCRLAWQLFLWVDLPVTVALQTDQHMMQVFIYVQLEMLLAAETNGKYRLTIENKW